MMDIRGIIPSSLIDYPENISATIFLAGCDFRCGFCHNPALLGKGVSLDLETVIRKIQDRKRYIDGVCITGGEPLMHDLVELISFIRRIKEMGLKIKLDTNGSRPDKLKMLLPYLDYVAMDIKTSFEKYHVAINKKINTERIRESIALVKTVDHEFRTTLVPGIVELKDLPKIGALIDGSRRFVIQRFVPDVTFNPRFKNLLPYDDGYFSKAREIMEGYITEVIVR